MADHEVERIARLMHAARDEFRALIGVNLDRRSRWRGWDQLPAADQECYRFIARAVIDDPAKRM